MAYNETNHLKGILMKITVTRAKKFVSENQNTIVAFALICVAGAVGGAAGSLDTFNKLEKTYYFVPKNLNL